LRAAWKVAVFSRFDPVLAQTLQQRPYAGLEAARPGFEQHPTTLVENLSYSDPFLVLADSVAYVACQAQVSAGLGRRGALDPYVDPQHRARRKVLIGPIHPGVL
jgi:hypothetical protein